MLSYGLEQGDMKLALTTCNTIKKMCVKVEAAGGGGVKEVLREVFGKGWRKAARGQLQEIQAKMAQSKKLYDVAVEVEKRWMAPREKEGKELEYHKDFTRIQMMNI
jgi:predicted DNA-binding ArsR family transcriptional regulator